MAPDNLGRLMRWYPPAWRDRYGEEFVAFMQDSYGSERPPIKARVSIRAGGVRERARRSGLTGDSVPSPERVRAGVLMVVVSWTVMVVAGSTLAKMSEHFDTALPDGPGAHHLPDLSYTVIQTVAEVAGLIVLAGAALALPTLLRFLRSGGWPSIRAHALRAAGCTATSVAATVPVVVWAHHLTSHQRNGGSTTYTTIALICVALAVLTLAAWTVLAVAAARKVYVPRSVLIAEAGMAVAVAFAIMGVLIASTVWWTSVAQRAPAFVSSDPRLVATATLMVFAAVLAAAGAIRIVRCLPASLQC